MTDPNTPGDQTPDTTPTESLPLADQQPVTAEPIVASTAAVPAPVEHRNHTRTILEVVGGVVAAGLIIVAGAVGFFVGHATGSDHDGDRFATSRDGGQFGPQADGQGFGEQGRGQQGQGMPMMPGQGQQGFGGQGDGQRGIDPDGDNWTGQNRQGYGDDDGDGFMGGLPGQQGMPMMPGQGQDPRGIDPDGDNWTGQNQQDLGQGLTQPTPQG